ncbi:ATP-dependent helicase HrpB [Streptomyces iconiensis]|uniref:ATP-dependent helicase HrpB n=1 Tax=Streptomyces iconiensis TaxID=1384038 RepID=A0ABT6ZVU0_9ACTN|nr:ATP-dependent helicase HrpB [Streptomyces iconiensis]MDJ1133186.1 ATP-dependent helicase HrpB [Streptomyces iconiensis]
MAAALPEVREALEARGAVVLHAPPGTGKTTLVPLALAGLLGDGVPARNVLVAEPRRMAARSAARRMAWLLGERPGEQVGFTVRGERRAGPRTRVEVVTTGVLLQRLQRDPELPGVDVVLMDECHERHLDADTALAFLLDVRATLRPGLWLAAASATQDSEAWARLLEADVVRGKGTSHPVEVRQSPPPSGVRPAHGTWVDPALLRHVAATVRRALEEVREGDVLCFLPGVGEIARVASLLGGGAVRAEVLELHGRAPAGVQDAVLRGGSGAGRRVILSTAVAESSVTVPGVRVVVDAGLSREPRTDHARGLGSLATVRVSRAGAVQRAGRAGREAPGVVYRCWSAAGAAGETALPREPSPEISVADLTAFALQAACWGDPTATGLALLNAPPEGAMAAARRTLLAIGALDEDGRATARGARMARIGLHPRLARALLDGAAAVGSELAAGTVALLSEEPPRTHGYGDDAVEALRMARGAGRRDPYGARWHAETARLRALLGEETARPAGLSDEAAVGTVVALAQPERLARRQDGTSYLMVGGTRAELARDSRLRDVPWLAVAVADRPVGAASARVRLAAAVDEKTATGAAGALRSVRSEVLWDTERGAVSAREVESLGAVELSSRPLRDPGPARVRAALLDALRTHGTGLLRWSDGAVALRARLSFLHHALGEPWPDVSDEVLLSSADTWLTGQRLPAAADLLHSLLPWSTGEAARLEELAPERLEVPSGSRVRVDYGRPEQPVLAVKLQEMFGARETPRLAGGRVPVLMHLLSPAGRPAAVTADLASFWREGYRGVRAELRGRYPKHPWPQDPSAAEPTRRTNARPGRRG